MLAYEDKVEEDDYLRHSITNSRKTLSLISFGLTLACCLGVVSKAPDLEFNAQLICIVVALVLSLLMGLLSIWLYLDPRVPMVLVPLAGGLFAFGAVYESQRLIMVLPFLIALHVFNGSLTPTAPGEFSCFPVLQFRHLAVSNCIITITAVVSFAIDIDVWDSGVVVSELLAFTSGAVALLIGSYIRISAHMHNYNLQKIALDSMDEADAEKGELNRERLELREEVFVGYMDRVGAPIIELSAINLDSPWDKAMGLLGEVKSDITLPKPCFDKIKEIGALLQNAKNLFSPDIEAAIEDKTLQVDEETERYLVDMLNDSNRASRRGSMPGHTPAHRAQSGRHLNLPGALVPNGGVEGQGSQALRSMMEGLESWDFDVFEVHRLTKQPLVVVGMALFKKYNLIDKFNIQESCLTNFLKVIESGYQAMPYHNSSHAADVTRSVHYFLKVGNLRAEMSDEEIFAAITGSLIHDYDHPGLNNNFLINTEEQRALLYNDKAVLENHHVAQAHMQARKDENNIFAGLDVGSKKSIRKNIIDLVLATDLSEHFGIVGQFKTLANSGVIDLKEINNRMLCLKMALKCGDLGHAAKPLGLHRIWTSLVTEEFYNQGDKERAADLQVSPFMDRSNANLPKSQVGFIRFLVSPMYEEFMKWLDPDENLPCLKNLRQNHDHWQKKGQ